MGLLLSQLPESSVELSHPVFNRDGSDGSNAGADMSGGVTQLSGDVIEKVMTIEPGEGATLTLKVDYMKGGVGGQTPPGIEGLPVSVVSLIFMCVPIFRHTILSRRVTLICSSAMQHIIHI